MGCDMIVGTCSACGGTMVVPDVWGGITPPTPRCSNCGGVAVRCVPVLPVIQVVPEPKREEVRTGADTNDILLG